MYLLYAHLVSPVVEPSQLTAQEPRYESSPSDSVESQPTAHDATAAEFLPDQNWAQDAENHFKIGDMYVYANRVDHEGGNAQVRFSPFALVWKNPKGKPDEPH